MVEEAVEAEVHLHQCRSLHWDNSRRRHSNQTTCSNHHLFKEANCQGSTSGIKNQGHTQAANRTGGAARIICTTIPAKRTAPSATALTGSRRAHKLSSEKSFNKCGLSLVHLRAPRVETWVTRYMWRQQSTRDDYPADTRAELASRSDIPSNSKQKGKCVHREDCHNLKGAHNSLLTFHD